MSLLPHSRLAPAGTPRTHALVIGVSDYRNLDTGVGATFGLGKLEAPVPSATAFADFLLNEYDNPAAPLSTVEFLVSGGQYKAQNSPAVAVEEPLFKNIKDAFDQWYELCDQSADNVGIFYFCGHGFDPGTMTLLSQDFGVDQNNIWSQAIDFDTTYWAMVDNKAIAQCYFIDACREKPIETLYGRNFKPTPLRTSATLKGKGRAAPTLKAAIDGRKALAPRNGLVSYFTQGLLHSFRNIAGYDNGMDWLVSTDSIVQCMLNVMRRTTLQDGTTVPCTPFGEYNVVRDLHRMPKPPRVLASVKMSQDDAHAGAQMSLVGTEVFKWAWPAPWPWLLEIPMDTYDVETKLSATGRYTKGCLKGQRAYPPEFRRVVPVT